MVKWLKHREMWAWGTTDWTYEPLFVDKINKELELEIRERMEEQNESHYYTDKFRKSEWDIINTKKVPNSKINDNLKDLKSHLKYLKEDIKTTNVNILVIEKLFNKGCKKDPDEIEK